MAFEGGRGRGDASSPVRGMDQQIDEINESLSVLIQVAERVKDRVERNSAITENNATTSAGVEMKNGKQMRKIDEHAKMNERIQKMMSTGTHGPNEEQQILAASSSHMGPPNSASSSHARTGARVDGEIEEECSLKEETARPLFRKNYELPTSLKQLLNVDVLRFLI